MSMSPGQFKLYQREVAAREKQANALERIATLLAVRDTRDIEALNNVAKAIDNATRTKWGRVVTDE